MPLGVLCMLLSAWCPYAPTAPHPVFLSACLPACLPACPPSCLPAWHFLPACLPPILPACTACSKEALFPGKSEIDELQLILKTMGSPTEQSWPGGRRSLEGGTGW